MDRFSAFNWLKTAMGQRNSSSKSSCSGKPLRRARYTPRLEILEPRMVLSTFAVLNLADSGAGSLRQAILSANANPGADTIQFAKGVHGTIGLTSGQLIITDDLSIAGPGQNKLTVSGNNSNRVFETATATVNIADLTIANGSAVEDDFGGGGEGGGGILNVGLTLTLTRVAVNNNTATAAFDTEPVFGGGLLNVGGTTIIDSCTFSGNQALGGGGSISGINSLFGGSNGGGIENLGDALTVTNSTFVNNKALGRGVGSAGEGGAIGNDSLNNPFPLTATITDCVFTDNLAGGGARVTGYGGALVNEGFTATMTVSGSRFVGNEAGESDGAAGIGGAILNFSGSTMNIEDCAINDNLATGGAGQTQNGGGIDNKAATMTISDSTLKGNRSIGGDGADGLSLFGESLGGGILNLNSATLTVLNSSFIDNQAIGGNDGTPTGPSPLTDGGIGGGIANFTGSTLVIRDSTFRENVARGGSSTVGVGGSALGGAVQNNASALTLIDSTVADNSAIGATGGSGFASGLAAGGGLDDSTKPGSSQAATASIINSDFRRNQATGGDGNGTTGGDGTGGAISVGSYARLFPGYLDPASLSIADSILARNIAQGGAAGNGDGDGGGGNGLGGGLVVQVGSSASVTNSRIVRNLALGGEASADGSDGQGIGGGDYDLGTFTIDVFSAIKRNDASTSNDNRFPS